MSSESFYAQSGTELSSSLLAGVRADREIQALLGDPVRLFADHEPGAAMPYVELERHETTDTSTSEALSFEHRFQFASLSQYGGIVEAKSIIMSLRRAITDLSFALVTQRVVLIIPTYCDVMRSKNQHMYRGLLRVRVHTEEK